jgi:hypothetical protein
MGSDPYNPENKNHPSDRNWAGIRNAPEEKRDYGQIPFVLCINGSRFAEGTATVEENEALFNLDLEDGERLKRYVANGMFDGATLSINFHPAVPAFRIIAVDPERERQNRRLFNAAGLDYDGKNDV